MGGDKLSARTLGLSGEIWNAQLCISRSSSSSSRSSDLTPPTGQTLEQDVGIGAGQMFEEVHYKEMLEEDQVEEMSEEDQEKKGTVGVGRFSVMYGGAVNRGCRPSHTRK